MALASACSSVYDPRFNDPIGVVRHSEVAIFIVVLALGDAALRDGSPFDGIAVTLIVQ